MSESSTNPAQESAPAERPPSPKYREFQQKLMVRLNEKELADRGRLLVEIQDQQEDLRSRAKRLIEQAKELQDTANELAEALRHSQELREVRCQTRIDYEIGLAITSRMDTWDVIERRALAPSEMQQELPLGEHATPAAAEAEVDSTATDEAEAAPSLDLADAADPLPDDAHLASPDPETATPTTEKES